MNGKKGFYSKDDMAQGATEFTVLLVLAAPLPMLGVSAGLGSIAFSLRGFAGPGGLQLRTEVALPAGHFLVMWNSLDDLIMVPGTVTPCLVGMVLPLGVLAAAVPGGLRKKCPRRWRVALILGVLSCLMYVFPAVAAATL